MARNKKKKSSGTLGWVIFGLLCALLLVLFIGRGIAQKNRDSETEKALASATANVSAPAETALPAASTAVTMEATPAPTAEPTPTPTPEPQPEYFTLSFIGDNTLWSTVQFRNSEYGLPMVVGDDTSYPYKNTVQYFTADEYTLANLECTFSDETLYSAQQFYFCAPSSYANILVDGGVDFVTMANNHEMDFYENGVLSTQAALDAVNIPYGDEGQAQIVTTPNGLKLGIYTAYNTYHPEDKMDQITSSISQMRSDGADLIICMFHWGQELYYTPNENQTNLAHACIDAGADIVYGTHPHCLQPIEEYGNGIILYSLGNWVFGGNTNPTDPDTAILQVQVKRDLDGSVSYDSINAIPCCVSSDIDGAMQNAASYNNYCPTPYEEGSEGYERAMSKLLGTFEATSEGADYSAWYSTWS